MKLNLDFDQLSAVLAMAIFMGQIDGEFTDEEIHAFTAGLLDKYEFGDDDLFNRYILRAKAMNDDRDDWNYALSLIKEFEPHQRAFLADMITRVMKADGVIDPNERELYDSLVDALSLPPLESENRSLSNRIAPTYLGIGYLHFSHYEQGSMVAHQPELKEDGQMKIFDYIGAETIDYWKNYPLLKAIAAKLDLPAGKTLIMFQNEKHGSTPNKAASLLLGKPVTDTVGICISNDGEKNSYEGFTDRRDLVWLVKAIDFIAHDASLIDGPEEYFKYNKAQIDWALKDIADLPSV